jgi:hypothetical protein
LLIEELKLLIERGVPRPELRWLFKERLGHDGEELRRVGRAIIVDDRPPKAVDIGEEPLVFAAQHPRPRRVHRGARELRRAVSVALLLIKLVRELVQNEVMPVAQIGGPGEHAVPSEHDDAPIPRLAEPRLPALDHDAARRDGRLTPQIGPRIDEDHIEIGVVVRLAVEQQQTRLDGDRDLDLVGELEPSAPLERLFSEEDVDVPQELSLIVLREAEEVGHVLLDDREPFGRKRLAL